MTRLKHPTTRADRLLIKKKKLEAKERIKPTKAKKILVEELKEQEADHELRTYSVDSLDRQYEGTV